MTIREEAGTELNYPVIAADPVGGGARSAAEPGRRRRKAPARARPPHDPATGPWATSGSVSSGARSCAPPVHGRAGLRLARLGSGTRSTERPGFIGSGRCLRAGVLGEPAGAHGARPARRAGVAESKLPVPPRKQGVPGTWKGRARGRRGATTARHRSDMTGDF